MDNIELKDTRSGFGAGLLELGKKISREELLKNIIETIDQTIQKQIHL